MQIGGAFQIVAGWCLHQPGQPAVGGVLTAPMKQSNANLECTLQIPLALNYLCTVNNITNPVILFDGVCNLCNSSVQFIIRKDKKSHFNFASLQGQAGQLLLQKFNLPLAHYNSFVLVEGGQVFTQSTAALRVFKKLGAPWSLAYGCIIIPRFIRDAVYRLIAKNRYKWFGKKEYCMIPSAELRARFLD